MLDDPLPNLFGGPREIIDVTKPVAQLPERLRVLHLRELNLHGRVFFQELFLHQMFPDIEPGRDLVDAYVGFPREFSPDESSREGSSRRSTMRSLKPWMVRTVLFVDALSLLLA